MLAVRSLAASPLLPVQRDDLGRNATARLPLRSALFSDPAINGCPLQGFLNRFDGKPACVWPIGSGTSGNPRILLIGSSSSVLDQELGSTIDDTRIFDVVVRCNCAPSRGFEKHVGTRTTHRMVNE